MNYPHMLSPWRVGNVVLRNRLFSAPMGLHCLQGSEQHPTKAIIQHYAEKARGGAAVVTCSGTRPYSMPPTPGFICYDLYAKDTQHYLSLLADAIHFYGAKASMEITVAPRDGSFQASAGNSIPGPGNQISKEITLEAMDEAIDNLKLQVVTLKKLGFDMIMFHVAYNMGLLGSFLSLRLNRRTDEYGGCIENRVRFLNRCCDAVHEAAGRNFLIELRMSGTLPQEDGFAIEDACQMAKAITGHVDLMQVHAPTEWQAHPMSFEPHHPNLWMADAIKKSGAEIPIVTIGGYQDPDEIEALLAAGKADAVSMARGWLADPYLGKKAQDGNANDVVPCIACMRCHDSACIEGTTLVCSVNPRLGIEQNLLPEQPVSVPKRVAVVGGGPAGMMAALTLSDRGHTVTLFEGSDHLGGQLNFADFASFKSSLAAFKRWLIAQVQRHPITIRYGIRPEAQQLSAEGYQVVIAALGAVPVTLSIPGIENAIPAPKIFCDTPLPGRRITIIGGGQVGCESALFLAQQGNIVTVIEMQPTVLSDASPSYQSRLLRNITALGDQIQLITDARCISMGAETCYQCADGTQHTVCSDHVILAAGMKPQTELALSLFDPNYEFHMIGDCLQTGNVQKVIRSAYSVALEV